MGGFLISLTLFNLIIEILKSTRLSRTTYLSAQEAKGDLELPRRANL